MEPRRLIERFKGYLADQGLKLTAQRRAIAKVFFGGEGHLSLTDILALAREELDSIGYATVYRTMRLMTEGGFAHEHKFGEEGQARYEPAHDDEHHDHLICVDCGVIVEFADPLIETRQRDAAEARGFEVVDHRHEVYVRCRPDHCRNPDGPPARPDAAAPATT